MEPEENPDHPEEDFEICDYSNSPANSESNPDDAYFDSIVGALQDIVIADSF